MKTKSQSKKSRLQKRKIQKCCGIDVVFLPGNEPPMLHWAQAPPELAPAPPIAPPVPL